MSPFSIKPANERERIISPPSSRELRRVKNGFTVEINHTSGWYNLSIDLFSGTQVFSSVDAITLSGVNSTITKHLRREGLNFEKLASHRGIEFSISRDPADLKIQRESSSDTRLGFCIDQTSTSLYISTQNSESVMKYSEFLINMAPAIHEVILLLATINKQSQEYIEFIAVMAREIQQAIPLQAALR